MMVNGLCHAFGNINTDFTLIEKQAPNLMIIENSRYYGNRQWDAIRAKSLTQIHQAVNFTMLDGKYQ